MECEVRQKWVNVGVYALSWIVILVGAISHFYIAIALPLHNSTGASSKNS